MVEYLDPSERLVTVFGGSGFVGRHIIRAFARRGWRVRAAVRRPDLANFLQPIGGVGQVQSVQANLRYPESVAAAVAGARIVINAAGVKAEHGRQTYEAVHVEGSRAIAAAAKAGGADQLIHISGIGVDPSAENAYIASKARAEAATLETFPGATILRPSVVFGPEDGFFNHFAEISRFFFVLPVFTEGNAKLQPVYVGDVARAAAAAVDGNLEAGKVYELGGPEVMTLREAMQLTLRIVERKRKLVNLSATASYAVAGLTEVASLLTLGRFPSAFTTTRDQVLLLDHDNVVSEAAIAEGRTLAGLGITAQGVEAIAPSYLWRYRKSGQYEPSQFA